MPATSGMDAPLMEEDSANMSASSYCDPVYINSTTEAPAGALADDESSRDPPSPLLRKGSSFRLLRRKVSFTGVPSTLPPEVEPRSSPWTPKRMGSRRLSGSSSSVEDANTEVTQTQRQYKDEATQCDEQQVAQYSGRASPYAGPPFQYGQLQPPPTYYVRQQVQQLAESSEKASEAPQPGEGEGSQQSGNAVNQTNWAQLQPTLARSSLSGSSRRGSFSRRNSMITLPYHANRLPNEYRPSMPNCIMTTFPCPVYRPTFPPLRSAPFGAYSANRTTY
ncbi:hypothetical protein ABL78_2817 [Leptomonas seymouri]|uniref:Uncharacterized protein n=1 Tax=Leptomonas seymouri TaxID=5684 RepID=A0A0N0P7A2_LEPSE|nr:hypothetical protein ABL78_2817 [Leptomonas seymouri]|eukprot:KPI88087.1 hypothetical protein ABL78_2817 [Leptomonas seymouri]